jgi:predicted nuclease of restriction endonuclease-like (RecB) superfamily
MMPHWYPQLLDDVSGHVVQGRQRVVRAANTELLTSYWAIGREILDRQEAEGYGTGVIDRLSEDLKERFPAARGFSPRNLKYMRAFAAAWSSSEVVQRTVAQLPWRHVITLLTKLDDIETRTWYAAAATEEGWSRDVLALQIDSRLHERSGRAISNFTSQLPAPDSDLAQQATKDPYVFDFVLAEQARHERDLERQLVTHVERFLLELGQGFAFVGSQVRLSFADTDYYADLLFYHIKLRRYVVIELKAVHFKPDFIGQLGMYMAAVDDLLAAADERPTIGLLLCKTKDDVMAEYALRSSNAPIGVAEWQTQLTRNIPDELASSLPSVDELEAELAAEPWDDSEENQS